MKTKIILCLSIIAIVIILIIVNNTCNFNPYKNGVDEQVESVEISTYSGYVKLEDKDDIDSVINLIKGYTMHYTILPNNKSGNMSIDIHTKNDTISVRLLDGYCNINGIGYKGDDYATKLQQLIDSSFSPD